MERSIEDLLKDAGEDVMQQLRELFEEEEHMIRWFYHTTSMDLRGLSPYEACRRGQSAEVYRLLGRLNHGVF